MPKSKADKLLDLAAKGQIITAADVAQLGIPRTYLPVSVPETQHPRHPLRGSNSRK